MKAVVIPKPGPPEVLTYQDWPMPEPKPGEVRVKVHYSGVNFADTSARVGLYPDAPKNPSVIGYEVSGTVDKLGEGVTGFSLGQRVMAFALFGCYAEYACAPAMAVRALPDSMPDDIAAAIPVVYVTAYHMLHYMTVVHPGDRVLVHAAAGGVGIAAVQMAKAQGAVVFGTASASKHGFLRELGVDHCIDYRSQDFYEEVRRITNGEGVDIVMDALGGSALKKSFALLRQGGRLFTFGFSRSTVNGRVRWPNLIKEFLAMPTFKPMKLMDDNRSVTGVNMNHLAVRPDIIGRELDGLVDLWSKGVIKPKVDLVVKAQNAAEAHRYLDAGKNIGKVLLEF